MYLEIVSPEATLFSAEVNSVVVPGINGDFEMLTHHAAIVSILKSGTIRVKTNGDTIEDLHDKVVPLANDSSVLTVAINSGTIEMNANKLIILAD